MQNPQSSYQSLWQSHATGESFPSLTESLRVDVVVIGAGITGLTAAALLKAAGRTVVVLEKSRIDARETGHTTAHLTEIVDTRYQVLAQRFGRGTARAVAQSSRAAIELIRTLSKNSNCGFEKVPGFLYTERSEDLRALEQEALSAQEAGLKVTLVSKTPLPFEVKAAMRVEDQAQFHPVEYLIPLARSLVGDGSFVFENTKMVGVRQGEPCVVETEGGLTIEARDVVVAANVPVINRLLLHTKISPHRSYAVAGLARSRPAPGLYWDMDDPYHYTRSHSVNGRDYLIVGGEDHKTGQEEETPDRYRRLEEYARSHFGMTEFEFRWSGQILEPVDGLPFIGRNSASRHVQVATGFSGNGMTFGTLAGMICTDAILGRPNPWAELYAATRVRTLGIPKVIKDYVSENIDYPRHLITDRLAKPEGTSVSEVGSGEGKILKLNGHKVAVSRDERGKLHAVSPVCTHLGCHVGWNAAEQSWDCPCHGGRFDPDGKVINGPPVSDLRAISIDEEEKSVATEKELLATEREPQVPTL